MCKSNLHIRKNVVYMGFINLEMVYNRVNQEALCYALKMYDLDGKLLSGIKSMYVDTYLKKKGRRMNGLK